MSTPSIANNAYQMASNLLRPVAGEEKAAPSAGAEFGQLVENAVGTVVDKGRDMDAQSIGLMQGKADVVDVVTAIAETETALKTMVSVRDRVIAAYEEIMRMPV